VQLYLFTPVSLFFTGFNI